MKDNDVRIEILNYDLSIYTMKIFDREKCLLGLFINLFGKYEKNCTLRVRERKVSVFYVCVQKDARLDSAHRWTGEGGGGGGRGDREHQLATQLLSTSSS